MRARREAARAWASPSSSSASEPRPAAAVAAAAFRAVRRLAPPLTRSVRELAAVAHVAARGAIAAGAVRGLPAAAAAVAVTWPPELGRSLARSSRAAELVPPPRWLAWPELLRRGGLSGHSFWWTTLAPRSAASAP